MTICTDLRDHVFTITIDRPETRNALDLDHYVALGAAWRAFDAEPAARVAIVTGTDRSFCAGSDLKAFVPRVTAGGALPEEEIRAGILIGIDLDKPIVAAVNGFCLGSGFEMLLSTDIRIASTEASFGLPEVRYGLFSGGGSTVRLPRQIAHVHAMDILLTGRRVTADEALAIGLVNRVVAPGLLLDAARETAASIAANGPFAVRGTKRVAIAAQRLPDDEARSLERATADAIFAHPDAQEGPRAFAGKRAPQWRDG